MVATTVKTKRKLSKGEQAERKVFKKALWYLSSPRWVGESCVDFEWGCPNCELTLLKGLLNNYIATIEF